MAELSHGLTRILPPYPFARQAPRLFVRKRLRRVVTAAVERVLNCFTPIRIVVAMKGVPYADSRRPDTMVARFENVDIPTAVPHGRPTPWIGATAITYYY